MAAVCATSVISASAVVTNAATTTSIVDLDYYSTLKALNENDYPVRFGYALGGLHFGSGESLGCFKDSVDCGSDSVSFAESDMRSAIELGDQKAYATAKQEYVKAYAKTETLKYIDFDDEKYTVWENVKNLAYTAIIKAEYKEISVNHGLFSDAKRKQGKDREEAFKAATVKEVSEEQYIVYMDAGFSFDLNKLFGSDCVATDYNTAPYMSKSNVEKTGATNYKQYKVSSTNKIQFWNTEDTYNIKLKITNGNQTKNVNMMFLVIEPTKFVDDSASRVFYINTTGNTSYKNIVSNFSKANIAEVKNGGKYTLEALTNIGNGETPSVTKLNWVITKGANLISLNTSYHNPEGICFSAKGTGSVEGYANTYNGTVKRFIINIK